MKIRVLTALALIALTPAVSAAQNLEFTDLAAMNSSRFGHGYDTDGSSIYVANGSTSGMIFPATIESYDPATGVWEEIDMATSPSTFGGAASYEPTGQLIILNGSFSFGVYKTSIEGVDLATGDQDFVYNNPYPRSYAGVAVIDDLIYVVGGNGQNQFGNIDYLDDLLAFDPVANEWSELAPMPEGRETRAVAVDGQLYALGGFDGFSFSDRIDRYDPATDTWQAAGSLPSPLSAFAVARQGRYIWLLGDFQAYTTILRYDTETQKTEAFSGENFAGMRHGGAAVIGDSLYVFGGQ